VSQVTANVASGAKRASVKLGEVLSPAASWAGTPQENGTSRYEKHWEIHGKLWGNASENSIFIWFQTGSEVEELLRHGGEMDGFGVIVVL
jgi:hypothetical protein